MFRFFLLLYEILDMSYLSPDLIENPFYQCCMYVLVFLLLYEILDMSYLSPDLMN